MSLKDEELLFPFGERLIPADKVKEAVLKLLNIYKQLNKEKNIDFDKYVWHCTQIIEIFGDYEK